MEVDCCQSKEGVGKQSNSQLKHWKKKAAQPGLTFWNR